MKSYQPSCHVRISVVDRDTLYKLFVLVKHQMQFLVVHRCRWFRMMQMKPCRSCRNQEPSTGHDPRLRALPRACHMVRAKQRLSDHGSLSHKRIYALRTPCNVKFSTTGEENTGAVRHDDFVRIGFDANRVAVTTERQRDLFTVTHGVVDERTFCLTRGEIDKVTIAIEGSCDFVTSNHVRISV
nr:MAG TPA: hypothetical protein [Caudoviricetes sp.]